MPDLPSVDLTRHRIDTFAATAARDRTGPAPIDREPPGLAEAIVRALAEAAPATWSRLNGEFSIAGDEEAMQAVALTDQHSHSIPIGAEVADMVRLHRRTSVGPRGPWLRWMFTCDREGNLKVGFDHGTIELPSDYLLSRQAYRQDIERYPRADIPLWLLAYMGDDGRQLRSAGQARSAALLTSSEDRVADHEVPPLPLLWARIAVLASVGRGSNTPVTPVTDPSFQRYAGDAGSCLLARLPGDRGVLSGGRDDSRLLTAAYRGTTDWPDLYRGAPAWLHNLYLDPRAAEGRLSFCYWWAGGHWYRAPLPGAVGVPDADQPWTCVEETAHAIPDVWSAASTAGLMNQTLRAIGVEPADEAGGSALRLVYAAEARSATEQHLAGLFAEGVPAAFDMAEALAQLDAADVLLRQDAPLI